MKTYNIITLGASGAGKTVFLASLFKALAIQGEHGFFLEVEDLQKRKLLDAIYTQKLLGIPGLREQDTVRLTSGLIPAVSRLQHLINMQHVSLPTLTMLEVA